MGEPTIYKPSIYNGNGIYKAGAAGGGGGGEYVETPSYLQEVEFVDTSVFDESTRYCVRLPVNIEFYNNYKWVVKLKDQVSAKTNNIRIFKTKSFSLDNRTNSFSEFEYRQGSPGNTRYWAYNDGAQNTSDNPGDLSGEIIAEMKGRATKFFTSDSQTYSRNSSYTMSINPLSFRFIDMLGYFDDPYYPFAGKLFYIKILDDTEKELFYAVPCRHKQTNNLFFFDKITGNNACDFINSSQISGVIFGPDVV